MSKYADFEGMRAQAVTLRRGGLSRREIADRPDVRSGQTLNRSPGSGCLIVRVAADSDLYRRIEGTWCGIVGSVSSTK